MAQPTKPVHVLGDLTGGINTAEPPDQIGDTQLADARNVEYRRTRGLVRRYGSVKNITGSLPFAANSSVVSLFRHTPGQSETSMELWGISNDTTPELARIAAGSSWSAVTLPDAIASASAAWYLRGVSFNGKLFLPYDSSVDRLHVWDGTQVRRVGIAAADPPTVANQGAGAYAATLRYYKVQWVSVDASGRRVYGPLSTAVSFTPSGAGASARVTRPSAASGETVTDWFLWGSVDNINYYLITGVPAATTFYDDSNVPGGYSTLQPDRAGFPYTADTWTPPLSAKYLLVDGQQLLLAGSWEVTRYSSRVWYTAALGTTGFDVEDDERVPSTNFLDIDPQLGGGITGIGGPIGGMPMVFKEERCYLLTPTNDYTLPYTQQLLSDVVGCISYQGIVMAEDEGGNPALYWPARRGIYRYGRGGLEYVGVDIEDLWSSVNFEATYGIHGVYHREAGQIWWHLPVGSDNTPSVRIKFHVQHGRRSAEGVRMGWMRDDGAGALSSASCMFSVTLGATMSRRLKPYLGKVASGGEVYKADADGEHRDDDDATSYTAYFLTRAIEQDMGQYFGVQAAYLQGLGYTSQPSVDVELRKDFATSASILATVALSTTRRVYSLSGIELSEAQHLQVKVVDHAGNSQIWSVDRLGLRWRTEAPRP